MNKKLKIYNSFYSTQKHLISRVSIVKFNHLNAGDLFLTSKLLNCIEFIVDSTDILCYLLVIEYFVHIKNNVSSCI